MRITPAAVANAALRFVRYLERRNESHPHRWRCRIGLATGPVVGSVVGIQKYVYDVFGPAVNLATRLRDHAAPMEIVSSGMFEERAPDSFVVEDIGQVDLLSFGPCNVSRISASKIKKS